jgi:rhodanese-related sulfurtransferase
LGGENLQKKKTAFCIILVALIASTLVLIKPASAEEGYQNISVETAKHMIKHTSNLLILDVRNQSEYDQGHLYNAQLLPLYQIQNWDWNNTSGGLNLNFLQAHVNDTVLVYCKAGSRSGPACEILAEHGFAHVYNMEGGLNAWMQAGYDIYTKNHFVQINEVDNKTIVDIQPWLLFQAGCATCQNQSCTSSSDGLANTTLTVVKQSENETVVLVTGETNGTAAQYSIDITLLSRYTTVKDGVNRTASFMSVQYIIENNSYQMYAVKYKAQNDDYNVTVMTNLGLSQSGIYNGSITELSYDPLGRIPIKSKEFAIFNCSAKLSDEYKMLGTTAKSLGKLYEKSNDYGLQQLAENYYIIEKEVKALSRIVDKNMAEYNYQVTNGSRGIMGVGLPISDPDAVANGGFESYPASQWTWGGYGDHTVFGGEGYESTYSGLVGYDYASPVTNGRDYFYQLIGIPAGATNIRFSFHYKLVTEDSADYDRVEVYVAPYNGNPMLFFSAGGSTRGGWETYGWNEWSTSLDGYGGYSLYLDFTVINGGDNSYRTYCFIDDVSVTYDAMPECDWQNWVNCVISDVNIMAVCAWAEGLCALIPTPWTCAPLFICAIGVSFYCFGEYCIW